MDDGDRDPSRTNDDTCLGEQLDRFLDQLQSGETVDVDQEDTGEFDTLRPVVELLVELDGLLGGGSESDSESPLRVGKYLLLDCLGVGGQSAVLHAYDEDLDRDVALKVYRQNERSRDQLRLRDEGRALAAIDHPNVAKCYALEQQDGVAFLVMEYVDGENLATLLSTSGSPDVKQCVQWMEAIAKGLAAIHRRGVLHRDLKPANIVISPDGDLKIVDLGYLHEASSPAIEAAGTAAYMAPEQSRRGRVDQRTDVYGMGAVFHCLLGGSEPAESIEPGASDSTTPEVRADLTRIRPELPRELIAITNRCLEPNPENRFDSAEAVLSAIARYRQDEQIRRRWSRSLPVILATILIVILGSLAWRPLSQRYGFASAVAPADATESPPSNPFDRPLRNDFALNVALARGGRPFADRWVLQHEVDYSLQVTAERDCYLQIYSLESRPVRLFPVDQPRSPTCKANRPTFLPPNRETSGDRIRFTAYRDPQVRRNTVDYLYVLASTVALDPVWPEPQDVDSPRYRGSRIRFDEQPNGVMYSEYVIPYVVE